MLASQKEQELAQAVAFGWAVLDRQRAQDALDDVPAGLDGSAELEVVTETIWALHQAKHALRALGVDPLAVLLKARHHAELFNLPGLEQDA